MDRLIRLQFDGDEKSLHLSRLCPRSVAQIFNLNENNIVLTDSTKVSYVPADDNLSFFDVSDCLPPLTVQGIKKTNSPADDSISQFHYRPYEPRPFSTVNRSHAPPVSYGLSPMAVPGGRHPVNSFGSGGGARGRSTTPQRLPESSKTLRVYIATRDAKGKPVNNRKMVHVTLERPEECNLVFVNEKLRQQPGCELRVICDSSGAAIIDDLTTRTPDYWGYGRGGATNATKFYALPDADTSDDDEWTGHGGGPKIRITDEEIDRIATSVAQKRIDMPMRNFLICLYCAGTSQLPIICTTCGHVIGCKRCVDSYIAEGAGEKHCPMETCQENWPRTDDGTHTGFVKLRGFDQVQKSY